MRRFDETLGSGALTLPTGRVVRLGPQLGRAFSDWPVLASFSCSPRHVQPGVDVRRPAEVPREGGAFQLPDVPDAVVADIAFLVDSVSRSLSAPPAASRHSRTSAASQARNGRSIISRSRRTMSFCWLSRSATAMPRARQRRSLELDGPGVIELGLGQRGLGFLLVVEGLEDLVGLFALVPPDVVGVPGVLVVMAVGRVAVKDRPAEGGPLKAVAVGAQGIVPAGQDPLEGLVGSRLAKDGHVVSPRSPPEYRLPSAS